MQTASVLALDYLEIGVADLDAWQRYAESVLGLAAQARDGALLLRMDADEWRIRLTPTGEDDVRALGFRVANDAAIEALRERLALQGIALDAADARDCADRGVPALWHCSDPDGLRIEFFIDPRPTGPAPFTSPVHVSGFVTGDLGFGHLVLTVRDRARADAFFQTALGMKLSDYVVLGPPGRQVTLTFLHCNARHHTVAYVPVPAPKRLNHFMLQAATLDDVGQGLDRAQAAGVPIATTLGKHSNDYMTSFYMRTPSGFDVEYGWGGREVDDAVWQVETLDSTSIWGHQRGHA
ncbi:MAG: VOC family protein [Gammaproteobacteria bacterium]